MKKATSPIDALTASFGEKVDAINEKLALNKQAVIHSFAARQVEEKRQSHRDMLKRVGGDLGAEDDELEQMIIEEEKAQTINDLMADDVRIDFEAIASSEHGQSEEESVALSGDESGTERKRTK